MLWNSRLEGPITTSYVSWEEDLERSKKMPWTHSHSSRTLKYSASEAHKQSIFGLLLQGFCCMQCQLSWKKSKKKVEVSASESQKSVSLRMWLKRINKHPILRCLKNTVTTMQPQATWYLTQCHTNWKIWVSNSFDSCVWSIHWVIRCLLTEKCCHCFQGWSLSDLKMMSFPRNRWDGHDIEIPIFTTKDLWTSPLYSWDPSLPNW